jgi:uncharacterized membrane protein YphA (DoxX/SURF4 family)
MIENPWVELAARWILGATFIVASYHKIVDPEGFAEAIYSYGLFPGNTINLIAIILPFLELFSGLALVFGVYRRAAVIVVSVMLILFIGALTINFIRGHQFDCGCFSFKGENAQSDAWILLLRDVLLLALGMFVFAFRGNRRYCIQRVS